MSFQQTIFLGASISSFSSSVGWNEQESQLNVVLVEDDANGEKVYWSQYNQDNSITIFDAAQTTTNSDNFDPPPVGYYCHFRFGSFEFNGILQSWQRKRDISGNPIYEVILTDPRSLLDATELIIGEYNGPVSLTMHNLLNVYGYMEDLNGFGGAFVNEAGMPWNLIRGAVLDITRGIAPNFGKPISYRGYTYRVSFDVTFPSVPDHFRISGTNITLMDAIRQVCQESGYDFLVKVINSGSDTYIHIKGVSRTAQPLPGQIFAYTSAAEAAGIAISTYEGLELRKEYTSAFIVGGNIEGIYQAYRSPQENDAINHDIWPYWGLDVNGNAILGVGIGDEHYFSANSSKVNIPQVGDTYIMNVGEIRAAIAGFDEWASYVEAKKPEFAAQFNMDGLGGFKLTDSAALKIFRGEVPRGEDIFGNAGKRALQAANINTTQNDTLYNLHKLYSFVYEIATEYYGKKFMVAINDVNGNQVISSTVESDTGRIKTNYEPSDGGWIEESDDPPLSLPQLYKDFFRNEDGRYQSMVRFNFVSGSGDLSEIGLDDILFIPGSPVDQTNEELIEDGDFQTLRTPIRVAWVKAEVEPDFVYINKAALAYPRAVVSIGGRVTERQHLDYSLEGIRILLELQRGRNNPRNAFGHVIPVAANNRQKGAIAQINANPSELAYYDYAPPAVLPAAAAIPLKSNTELYGPWSKQGQRGKVYFEQDTTLVPWNYGGATNMNIVGNSRVNQIVTNMQEGEMGTIQFAGLPDRQLGDQLTNGGPNITDINVEFGEGGVRTTYNLRTYTPQFGRFSKQNNEKLAKLSRLNHIITRNLRGRAADKSLGTLPNKTVLNNKIEAKDVPPNKHTRSQILTQKTPHAVMVGAIHRSVVVDDDGVVSESGTSRQSFVSSHTLRDAPVKLRADSATMFKESAMMGMEGLFRPFSMDTGNTLLPHFEKPASGSILTVNTLNPFATGQVGIALRAVTDIAVMTHGNTPPDHYFTEESGFDANTARGIGFRLPMIGVGWGYDTQDKPVPNLSADGSSSAFATNYRNRPDLWKAGPIDFRWDNDRKLWVTGSTTQLMVIVAYSGYFTSSSSGKPRYICRRATSVNGNGVVMYDDAATIPYNINNGIDKACFNLKEAVGDLHTVGVGTPVLVYEQLGASFFDAMPRSFTRRNSYV